jgi:hypothetical protein
MSDTYKIITEIEPNKYGEYVNQYSPNLARVIRVRGQQVSGNLVSEILFIIEQGRQNGQSSEGILQNIRNQIKPGGRLYSQVEGAIKRSHSAFVYQSSGYGQESVRQKTVTPDTKMKWVINSFNTCPDCLVRNGLVKTYREWLALGMPKSGFSVCGNNCKCDLIPIGNYPDGLEELALKSD